MKPRILKVLDKGSRSTEKHLKYLDSDFKQLYSGGHNINGHIVGEDNDAASISTASTNATADNIPGRGRVIDIYIYQFFGRKVERFADRHIGPMFSGPDQLVRDPEPGRDESTDEHDGSGTSISSESSNATADNIPGPGRIIDKHIYQFFGRKLERFADRLSMSRLPPARIAQRLGSGTSWWYNFNDSTQQISDVINIIHSNTDALRLSYDKAAVVAGLKSLVRQTKSNSVYRSAAALAALVNLSLSFHGYTTFVASVHKLEPLLHLETLASALDDSNTEKKYLAVLITLARERVCIRRRKLLTTTRVGSLQRRLIEILSSYRIQLGNDPQRGFPDFLSILGSACILCNECYDYARQNNDVDAIVDIGNYDRLLEILYFLTVFLIQCITLQCRLIQREGTRLEHMVLSVYMHWFQALRPTRADEACFLGRNMSMLASARIYVNRMHIEYHKMLERRCNIFLPRKMPSAMPEGEDTSMFKHQMRACMPRTRRLILSFEELDREARDIAFIEKCSTQHSALNVQLSTEYFNEESYRTRERAREYLAREIGVSKDTVKMMKVSYLGRKWCIHDSTGQVYDPVHDLDWDFVRCAVSDPIDRWRNFKETRQDRGRWGQYLRSNLDWDWDTASCLKRLFSKPRPIVYDFTPTQGHRPSMTFASELGARELNVTIDNQTSSPPEVVKAQYVTKAGEIKYRQLIPSLSVETLALSGNGELNILGNARISNEECRGKKAEFTAGGIERWLDGVNGKHG